MKILMLSIFSPHFFNWTEQLKDSSHEVYWLDVFDSNTKAEKIDFVHHIIGWRYKWDFAGRYWIKKKAPGLTKNINKINERKLSEVFEQKLHEIKPDVVHSFVMYLGTAPVLEIMQQYPEIKWIYSSWGSDLYYYRNRKEHLKAIQNTLPEIDYMFTDCYRDYNIAVENGFKGEFLGVFPGGGGFNFEMTEPLIKPSSERKIILVKGYQGLHGRCIPVLKALYKLKEELKDYELVVFGAKEEVRNYVAETELKNVSNMKVLGMLPNKQIMKLMGETLVFIGNSLSDGIPNTLLEAIIMGAFPIQSNPGGATAEIIENNKNGLLIEEPEDYEEIATLICNAVLNPEKLKAARAYNCKKLRPELERESIKEQVLEQYKLIEQDLKQ